MKYNFETFLSDTLREEGGYVNHPNDPGGPTNMGITQGTLSMWRGRPVTANDVKNITLQEVSEIYRKNYWDVVKGDELPSGLDLYVSDFGVNSGPSRSVRYLQEILGVTADGKMGPITLAAANSADTLETIHKLHEKRMGFLRGLSTWSTFGTGWSNRTSRILTSSVAAVATKEPSSAKGLLSLLLALLRRLLNV